MQISFNGIQALKEREGFKKEAYLDTGGVWTIGYGTTVWKGQPVTAGMVMNEAEAEEALREDLAWAQTAVNRLVSVKLTQNMYDALVSFVYNIGESAFAKSTMLRMLNMQLYNEAARQFDRWVFDNGEKVKGLINRRREERKQFEGESNG